MEALVIDYEEALDRLGGDEEFLAELLFELHNQIRESLSDIRMKLVEKDFEAIARMGHGLKGASANLDAKSINELCRQLEQSAKKESEEEVKILLEKIERENSRLKDYLNNN